MTEQVRSLSEESQREYDRYRLGFLHALYGLRQLAERKTVWHTLDFEIAEGIGRDMLDNPLVIKDYLGGFQERVARSLNIKR